MTSTSVIVRATAPFRSFLNQRFSDLHSRLEKLEVRMEELEKRVGEAIALNASQTQDVVELQKALLDSMILLGATVTEAKSANTADANPEKRGLTE